MEYLLVEALRELAQRGGIEVLRAEVSHHLGQCLGVRFMEEGSGHTLGDGVERAARRIGDDRPPRRLRLDRSDAEVLLAGEDEGAASGQQPDAFLVGHTAEESHVWPCQRLELGPIAAIAGDDKWQAERREGADGQVDPLVRDEA